jgi:hypothetical protein
MDHVAYPVDGDGSSPSENGVRHEERGECRSNRSAANPLAPSPRLDTANALAFARCSDLP